MNIERWLKNNLISHLIISISLYVLFALLDIYFTLDGIDGDVYLEGNPLIRYMMVSFGVSRGLIIEKAFVFLIALILAIIAFNGIEKRSDWVYYLAFTRTTRSWMKRKKRYWVAFVPLYFVALSQGLAASSWIFVIAVKKGIF